jgi:hypothetical protein
VKSVSSWKCVTRKRNKPACNKTDDAATVTRFFFFFCDETCRLCCGKVVRDLAKTSCSEVERYVQTALPDCSHSDVECRNRARIDAEVHTSSSQYQTSSSAVFPATRSRGYSTSTDTDIAALNHNSASAYASYGALRACIRNPSLKVSRVCRMKPRDARSDVARTSIEVSSF